MNARTVSVVLLSAFAALATACHPSGAEGPAAGREDLQKALQPRSVSLVAAEVREEHPTVNLVGEIRPFDTVTMAAEVAGRVEQVSVEVGDRVAAGDPLVQIDRESFKLRREQADAELAATRAQLDLAARELERKRDLVSDKTISQAAFDQAETAHDLAKARVAASEAALAMAKRDFDRSVVRAPSAGVVSNRTAVVGQWADVGNGVVTLALGSTVKIAARVPSNWVSYLQGLEGFDFTVRPGDSPRHAKLYSIDPVVSEASRSFEVVGTAPAADLTPGLFANVTLISPEPVRTLWIPATAVVSSDTPRLLTVEDGAVTVLKVQTGRRDDGMVEVVSGLDAGQEVIRDVAGLSRGLPVTVTGQE